MKCDGCGRMELEEMLAFLEQFCREWSGTAAGQQIKNMMDNSDLTDDDSIREIYELAERYIGY